MKRLAVVAPAVLVMTVLVLLSTNVSTTAISPPITSSHRPVNGKAPLITATPLPTLNPTPFGGPITIGTPLPTPEPALLKIELSNLDRLSEVKRLGTPTNLGISDALFTRDGRELVASWGNLIVWQMPSGEEISSIPLSTTSWTPLALSPDGQIAAIGNHEYLGWVELWNLSTQQLARQHRGGDQVVALGFNSTGSLLAAGRSDGSVTVWDVATGQLLLELPHNTGCCMGMAFNPVRDEIAANGPTNTVQIWNARSGQLLDELTCPDPFGCFGQIRLAYRPDGEALAATNVFIGNSILLWEGNTFVSALTLPDGGAMEVGSWSPDGRLLASPASGERIVLWDMQTLTVAATVDGVIDVESFSPDGAILVTEGWEGLNATLRVLSIAYRVYLPIIMK